MHIHSMLSSRASGGTNGALAGATSGRSNSFAGVAQQLVQQGVPAVLAMQFPVSDKAAIALSQDFYRSLSDGLPADAAVPLRLVRRGRLLVVPVTPVER